jgi:hypothetical protein
MPLPRHVLKFAEPFMVFGPFSHGSTAATATTKLWATAAGRGFRIGRVVYNNPTGLTANASNFFDVRILNGATIAAKWSSNTVGGGGDGDIVANTPFELKLQAAGTLVLPASTVLSLSLVLTGTQTLPAGLVTVEGYLV